MDAKNIKASALLSGLVILAGCGGGGDDKDNYYQTPSLTTTELAQVAAAIQASKTTFDVVVNDGINIIDATIKDGRTNQTIQCRSGSYRVTPNRTTAYSYDGLLANNECTTTTSKWDGAIDLECLDNKCDKSITTATGAVWADRNRDIELVVNGEMLSDLTRDGFKGNASIGIAGKRTSFDFADVGLIQDYYNQGLVDGFGKLRIVNGENNRCINGTYGYDITDRLQVTNNSLRVVGGTIKVLDNKERELGTVKFQRDGSVAVTTRSGATGSFSSTQFEGYCGLAEAYRFSTIS